MKQSSREKWNVCSMCMQTRESTTLPSRKKKSYLINARERLTVHTTGNAFSLPGNVEWSRPSNMTAAYTKMHPKAVKLLSFGLDNLIVLCAQHVHENGGKWKDLPYWK